MPFLRSSTPHFIALRTLALGLTLATTLATVATATPARADDTTVVPAEAPAPTPTAQATDPVADADLFCPRPTGKWWEDVTAHGCVEVLAGRDRNTPLTGDELGWLDLGDLPAYATIDIDAIGASIAAYEQRLADEAAAAEATVQQRSTDPLPRDPRGPEGVTDTAPGGATDEAWDIVPNDAGLSAEELQAERETAAYTACLERLPEPESMPGTPEWDVFFDTHARCVDAEVPGYYARWAAQKAEWDAEMEEGRRLADAAWDRLQQRKERALQEIRDTCPHGGIASPTKPFVSSYDEVEYEVTCNDAP